MNLRHLEYRKTDLPFLKKELFFRFLYLVLFLAIFVWQIIMMFVNSAVMTRAEIIAGVCTLIFSLMMALLTLSYAFRCYNIILEVKRKSNAVRTVRTFASRKKDTFLNLYSVVAKIITLVMVALLVSVVTYSILEIIYYSNLSFYIPLAAFITITGFNSVFHINFELSTVKEIHELSRSF